MVFANFIRIIALRLFISSDPILALELNNESNGYNRYQVWHGIIVSGTVFAESIIVPSLLLFSLSLTCTVSLVHLFLTRTQINNMPQGPINASSDLEFVQKLNYGKFLNVSFIIVSFHTHYAVQYNIIQPDTILCRVHKISPIR